MQFPFSDGIAIPSCMGLVDRQSVIDDQKYETIMKRQAIFGEKRARGKIMSCRIEEGKNVVNFHLRLLSRKEHTNLSSVYSGPTCDDASNDR